MLLVVFSLRHGSHAGGRLQSTELMVSLCLNVFICRPARDNVKATDPSYCTDCNTSTSTLGRFEKPKIRSNSAKNRLKSIQNTDTYIIQCKIFNFGANQCKYSYTQAKIYQILKTSAAILTFHLVPAKTDL